MTLLNTFGRIAGLSMEKGHTLQDILEVRRQRRALSKLTDRELRDIGLTPDDVANEVSRSIFDMPSRRPRTCLR